MRLPVLSLFLITAALIGGPETTYAQPLQLRSEVERWAKSQDDKPTLSKAICRLVEHGLAAKPSTAKPRRKP